MIRKGDAPALGIPDIEASKIFPKSFQLCLNRHEDVVFCYFLVDIADQYE